MKNIFIGVLLVTVLGINLYGEQQKNPPDNEKLFRRLSDKNVNIMHRLDAAETLSEVGDERALNYLLGFLNDQDEKVHSVALEHIGFYWEGDKRIVEPVIEALNYKDSYTRSLAASCLGNKLDKKAIEPLITRLIDKDEKVRSSAASAICRITFFNFNKGFSYENGILTGEIEEDINKWQKWWNENKGNINKVIITQRVDVLINKTEEAENRRVAIQDLIQLGMADQVQSSLIAILEDRNEDKLLREKIFAVLATTEQTEEIAPVCFKIVKDRSEEPSTRAIALAMLSADDNEAVNLLIQVVTNENEDLRVRRVAAGTLTHISSKNDRARDVIDKLMKNKATNKSIRCYIKAIQKQQGK